MASAYSLSIGLNKVDPAHYNGWDGALNAPENDARDIHMLTKSLGYSGDLLIGNEATRENVISAINGAATNLKEGDMFVLFYSGHGGQLPDLDGDEFDREDETWCLYDAELMDDHLRLLWHKFAANVRILVLSDSCHSGTVIKLRPDGGRNSFTDYLPRIGVKTIPVELALSTYIVNKGFYDEYIRQVDMQKADLKDHEINATVRLISGCQDNQSSYDGTFNSSFTGALKIVWNGGKFSGNYTRFHSEIQQSLPSYQSPNHLVEGRSNAAYDHQVPFTI
ncbi:caspase family protein [Dyadobacter chenhuakuii]|uniref:Caspase family protein n=1 Tax=Dyadobacter chenhuakuii TaxID=2909339 RepID=A0ABY4XMN2_9BACT|nr:caspase family protein [Dyadobacter chenhuakuii]MCF2494301.1 caspase family protein [Dyadobacter chenhuakuii]USJ31425.1 caspase family protein [Dyadobacter chenhuakuii]